MTSTHRDPVLIVVQLTGGNDYMNTVVPYGDPLYRDNRRTVGVAVDEVLPIDERYGFNPVLAPLKELYGRRQSGGGERHRLSEPQPVALPGHGYMAHVRT